MTLPIVTIKRVFPRIFLLKTARIINYLAITQKVLYCPDMEKILFCWIGETDLKASENKKYGNGPIARAVEKGNYKEVALLSGYPPARTEEFVEWLRQQTDTSITLRQARLADPTNLEEVYPAAVELIKDKRKEYGKNTLLTFHLSPGTPQMAAVWIILSAGKFPAELIKSSEKHGVSIAKLPFEISADFLPGILKQRDKELEKLAAGLPSEAKEFKNIIYRSTVMQRVILKAQRVALRTIPVLIEGESGTGKELLARAIHQAGPRRDGPFIPVNCGAISSELIESEFFGHIQGAFTGAKTGRIGYFESANKGTLFLDEIGELPPMAQVKLLRVVQEKEITKVGSSETKKIDVRIITATNRSLIYEVSEGKFREDLFYRLVVANIKIPPLRNREGDLNLLIDTLLGDVNRENENDRSYEHKKISAGAKKLMAQHLWPGNVRELLNTLHRAAVWSDGPEITGKDMKEAILTIPVTKRSYENIMNKTIEDSFDLQKLIEEVTVHYLKLAMGQTNNNKTKAAKLLGLANYQTLANWLNKFGLE
jgi:DNA-binding NtrC family response regulator